MTIFVAMPGVNRLAVTSLRPLTPDIIRNVRESACLAEAKGHGDDINKEDDLHKIGGCRTKTAAPYRLTQTPQLSSRPAQAEKS